MSRERPAAAAKVPGWYRLTLFLGRPPALGERQWRVLGLTAFVSLFEQYDVYLFALNLKQIQAGLAISEGDLGFFASVVRGGALFAIPIALAADRVGRRRLLLITVLGYTLLTGATALSPNMPTFVVLQFLARAFATAETLVAVVVIAEEFPPQHRGWGIGALGAIQACGAGLAAAVFAFVDVLPHGWRDLYLVGLVPLLLVAHFRRTLPETERFERLQRERAPAEGASLAASTLSPIVTLLREHPLRLSALLLAVAAFGVAASPAVFFAPKYLQDVHGWSPSAVALLTLGGGIFAIVGNPLAGWLGDRRGRRPINAAFSGGLLCAALGFYALSGLVAPAFWMLLIFTMMGCKVTLAAFGAELFPTAQRSTASGLRAAADELGAMGGLVLVSVLFGVVGSNWTAIMLLSAVIVLPAVLAWLAFPETAGRALEETAQPTSTAPGPARE